MGRRAIDISGQQFNRLTAIRRDTWETGRTGMAARWLCLCVCGNGLISVAGTALRQGKVQSCGCYARNKSSELRTTHGRSQTPEYKTWRGTRERCYRPKTKGYHRYGGRGIKVCKSWRNSFEAFLSDMGERPSPRHTLDRIDNNGNYEPGNCKWSTPEEQGSNRSDNHFVTVDGDKKTISEWSRISGNSRPTILGRLKSKWEPRKAVFHKKRII